MLRVEHNSEAQETMTTPRYKGDVGKSKERERSEGSPKETGKDDRRQRPKGIQQSEVKGA